MTDMTNPEVDRKIRTLAKSWGLTDAATEGGWVEHRILDYRTAGTYAYIVPVTGGVLVTDRNGLLQAYADVNDWRDGREPLRGIDGCVSIWLVEDLADDIDDTIKTARHFSLV